MMEATLRKETCQAVAQYILGVESVSEDVSIAIIEDTEYRLRQLLQESVKFMRNSKRTKLLPKDINSALRLENMEPIFGYSAPRRKQFRVVKSCPGLYVLDDDLVDLKRALDEPLPKAPFEPALEAHWLAVEGVQPAIWQNPLRDQLKDAKTTSESVPVEALKPLKHALSKEFQLLYDHVISILRDEDGKKLCSSWMDPHWHLRDYSSSVLGFIYKHFGPNYATLQTRVTKTLISALLDEKRPLSTRYGAIVGLVSLGVCEVQICLMPHLPYLSQQTEAELHRSDLEDERKLSLAKIYGALILAAHVCLKQNEMKETCRSFDTEEKNRILSFVPKFDSLVEVLYEQFGDSMFPTVSNYF
ncbi:Transcription initiation factor TFIID subunit 6 [Galdieria sulphuraria]|nr:Transcription initiation factor TFIID subunit 6 [Galdieria sulphuraria]